MLNKVIHFLWIMFKLQVILIPLFSVGAMIAFQSESDVCNLDYNFWAVCDLYAYSARSIELYSLDFRNMSPNRHQEELVNQLVKQYANHIPMTLKKILVANNRAVSLSKRKRNLIREESELLSIETTNTTVSRHDLLIITIAPKPQVIIGLFKYFKNYKIFRELIVLFFLEDLEEDYLQDLLQRYWSPTIKVLTTAVFAPCYRQSGFIYIHDPLYPRGNNWNGVVKKLRLEDVLRYQLPIENNVRNLHGYEMRISMFERQPTAHRISSTNYGGIDGMFLNILANKMNFTPVYIEPTDDTFGDLLPNGTATGALRHVIDGTCDIAGNSRFMIDTDLVHFSIPPYTESICVVVPKAIRIPHWLEIVQVFRWDVWVLILVSFLVCLCLRYIFYWFNEGGPRDSIIFLQSVAILFGIAVKLRRRGQHLLIMILIVFSLIFSNLLQSNLANIFTTKLSVKEIDTVEELLSADIPIITNLKVLENDPTETMRKLKTKQIYNLKHTKKYEFLCKYRNVSTLDRELNIQIMSGLLTDENGDACLHQMKYCLVDFTLSYLVQKTSPYLHEINKVLFALNEGGFVNLWIRLSMDVYARNYTKEYTDFKPLTVGHFYIAFYTLLFGYIVSILVFLSEVLRK